MAIFKLFWGYISLVVVAGGTTASSYLLLCLALFSKYVLGMFYLRKEASNLFFRHSYVSTVPEREEEKTKADPRGSDAIVFLLHCHCTQSCIWLTQPSRPSNTKSIQVGFIHYLITMSLRPLLTIWRHVFLCFQPSLLDGYDHRFVVLCSVGFGFGDLPLPWPCQPPQSCLPSHPRLIRDPHICHGMRNIPHRDHWETSILAKVSSARKLRWGRV